MSGSLTLSQIYSLQGFSSHCLECVLASSLLPLLDRTSDFQKTFPLVCFCFFLLLLLPLLFPVKVKNKQEKLKLSSWSRQTWAALNPGQGHFSLQWKEGSLPTPRGSSHGTPMPPHFPSCLLLRFGVTVHSCTFHSSLICSAN